MSQRYRNSIKNAKTYPGADVDTDHNLAVIVSAVILKTLRSKKKKNGMWKN